MHLTKFKGKLMQYMAGGTASLSLLAGGAVYAWINPVLNLLESPESPVPMTPLEASWVATLPEIGTLFTALPAGCLADHMGRKSLLLLVTPIQILSWTMIFFTTNIYVLMLARMLQGFAVGVVSTVLPMYLSEIAEPSVRGSLGNSFVLAFTLGQVYQYAIGPFVSYYTLALLSTIPSWIFLMSFVWFHESPYYLMTAQRDDDARKSLLSFRDTAAQADNDLAKMKLSIEDERTRKDSWKSVFNTMEGRKAMLISSVLAITVFMGGYNALISYSSSIFFKTTGMKMSSDMFTLGMGVLLSVSTFFCSFMLDGWGRRPTMLLAHWGSAFCLTVAGIFYLMSSFQLPVRSWWIIPVSAVILSPTLSLFGISASKVYQTELFSTSSRGFATGITTVVYGVVSSVTILMYNALDRADLVYLNYFIFAAFSLAGAVFIYYKAPETKGKTFQEIHELLSSTNRSYN